MSCGPLEAWLERPSTGPLERSAKAALVSGSSLALKPAPRRRPLVSAGAAPVRAGWLLVREY
jgi:hypothetical protein